MAVQVDITNVLIAQSLSVTVGGETFSALGTSLEMCSQIQENLENSTINAVHP